MLPLNLILGNFSRFKAISYHKLLIGGIFAKPMGNVHNEKTNHTMCSRPGTQKPLTTPPGLRAKLYCIN